VLELVYSADSKSVVRKDMRVRLSPERLKVSRQVSAVILDGRAEAAGRSGDVATPERVKGPPPSL
jgi:hypothetical protein